jgi:hypothetical protein
MMGRRRRMQTKGGLEAMEAESKNSGKAADE